MADLPDFTQSVAGISLVRLQNSFVNPSTTVDVSQYQSVVVRLGNLNGGDPIVVHYTFFAPDGTTPVDGGTLSCAVPGNTPAWTLPVVGQFLKLSNGTASATMVGQVFGSNVPARKRMAFDWSPARLLSATVPNGTAANTSTPLADLDPDPVVQNATSYNGLTTITWIVNNMGGATAWALQAVYMLESGVLRKAQILSVTVAGTVQFQFGHPFAFTQWNVQNTGALTGNSIHNMNMFPSETP